MFTSELKPLTAVQYDSVKAQAIKRIENRIGNKPSRNQFKREYGAIFGILDIFALIVFIAALAISSVHILAHIQIQSIEKYSQSIQALGITISAHDATIVQQVGMIVLAEFAMLLFMTVWSIERKKHLASKADKILTHSMLILAFTSMFFVIYANISTGIGILESIMPPVFTIGVGLRLEHIIVEMMIRRKDIDVKYTAALSNWERAIADPTTHPDYQSVMRRAVWDKLVSLSANRQFLDAPTKFKVQAVGRELERDSWAVYADFGVHQQTSQSDNESVNDDLDDTQPSEPIRVMSADASDSINVRSMTVDASDPTLTDSKSVNADPRNCENCHKKLPETARKNQRYCDRTCRQEAYLKRQNAKAS